MAIRLKDRIEANIRQSDKVNNSLSIQLNSGTTMVYDGSSAKSINITPAAIGALSLNGGTLTGQLSVPTALTILPQDDNIEGGEIKLLPANSNLKTCHIDLYSNQFRIHNGTSTQLSVDLNNGNITAANFVGSLQGNAATATMSNYFGSNSAYCGCALNSSVPTIFGYTSGGVGSWGFAVEANSSAVIHIYENGTYKLTHALLHTGNYFNYALPLTGGIISGRVFINQPLFISGETAWPSNTTGLIENGNQRDIFPRTGLYGNGIVINSPTCTSDQAWILCGSAESESMELEIATADDANECIFVRHRLHNGTVPHSTCLLNADGDLVTGLGTGGVIMSYSTDKRGPTGHTFSTSGSIGCRQENYAEGGYNTPAHYNTYYNGNWYSTVQNHGNSNIAINACGGSLVLGHSSTTTIIKQRDGRTYSYCEGYRNQYWTLSAGNGPWDGAAIEIREVAEVAASQSDYIYAPKLGFHWASRVACCLALEADGVLRLRNSETGLSTFQAGAIWGAVWNDYAEYRAQNEPLIAGHITYCDDDGKLKYTTERLQKFEGVVSDTFGFSIGETDECKTPLAVSGRALVYCNPEDHFHSGDCVCAGPDGKAYRMTREEIAMYPDRIVGVVSEIPTYERWGTGDVEVNGRIWIKVK